MRIVFFTAGLTTAFEYNAEHEARVCVGDFVKRLALVLVLMGCGGGARPAEVSLALPAPSVAAATPATLLACTIVGTGERWREGEEPFPFRVYESADAPMPVFVITHPEAAHVTWSQFPVPQHGGRGRAHAAIGGQAHVRYEGLADLYGRTFTTTTRMDSVDGHLWAHSGSPIDVMSASNGEIFGSVRTPFHAPRDIVVHGNCANVVYEPAVPSRVAKPRTSTMTSASPSFRLFATPSSARAFTTITPNAPVLFELVERKDEFVRVTADEGHIGFDAWVLASDVREISGGVLHAGSQSRRSTWGRVSGVQKAVVARDTPLYVGDAPLAVRDAYVEVGAVVVFNPLEAITADGRAVVPFQFEDLFIVAPEGERLWIAKDVVSSSP
jgi:hypothetical protein